MPTNNTHTATSIPPTPKYYARTDNPYHSHHQPHNAPIAECYPYRTHPPHTNPSILLLTADDTIPKYPRTTADSRTADTIANMRFQWA